MSKKQQNRSTKKQGKSQSPPPFNLRTAVGNLLKDRHPILKFLLGFLACMSIFYLVYFSGFYQAHIQNAILYVQANISSGLLNLFGYNTRVVDSMISSDRFSINIHNGCDGLEATAILISGILIFPATFRQKMRGLLWGVSVLAVLNIFRIAGLYLAGIYFSNTVFEVLHVQGGFIVFTMISVLLLFTWMNWATSQTPKPSV